jgi:alpha-L-rhamnosidase
LPSPRVVDLRAEQRRGTLGIGSGDPRLSFRLRDPPTGWRQSAYEIEARSNDPRPQSLTVASDESVLVPWPFDPLRAREQATIRARVHGVDGSVSTWSDELTVEAGLFEAADWTARFVTPTWFEDRSRPGPAVYLRREFEVPGPVARARLYATALGVYEPYLNGAVVCDHVLAPGWTSYDHRLRYQTFDVTPLLRPGRNALGAIVSDGWYRGRLCFHGGRRNIYGDRLALLAQLEIQYSDGTLEVLATDETWRAATGPILAADLYDGETYDARLERDGWATPGYDDGDWRLVATVERDLATLVAPSGPPVRRIELREPVSVARSPSGATIVDFGQNLVGRLRITAQGESGRTITLRHAEVLEGGELCVRPLRTAAATDRYVVRGNGAETWEPRFTFHGFRYAEVSGWPGDLDPGAIRAVVCHSDLERTGWFECSNPLVNRLHENVVWSMRGNFVDLPTDCPQRDERLGWTGDIAVFAPTATFLYDCAGFLVSWLADLAADQRAAGGRVPAVVPDILPPRDPEARHDWTAPTAGWGDAAVLVPWALYERFGDRRVLEAQYDSMRDWVEIVASAAGPTRVWREGFQFGDWLDPAAPPDHPERGRTDPGLVATAHFARSAELLADAASVLELIEDEAHYRTLAAEVRAAFVEAYVLRDGTLVSDSPTAYALALQFELLPAEQRPAAGRRLAQLVQADGYRIGTGFLGTPLILEALCSFGELDAAYRLLMQRECPSWLYPVSMGATTIWERWDSLLPDGTVNTEWMTSFNHYAFGAVADWLHRVVAGLAPAEPGYRKLEIRPRPGGGLTYAGARHVTPYGEAASSWRIEGGSFHLDVTVPSGATARVHLPATEDAVEVGPGSHSWSVALAETIPETSRGQG